MTAVSWTLAVLSIVALTMACVVDASWSVATVRACVAVFVVSWLFLLHRYDAGRVRDGQ